MIIKPERIKGRNLSWILRSPQESDALELSKLRVQIDKETEFLDRDSGEGVLTQKDFEKLIKNDSIAEKNLFLIAEVEGEIVGFTRCEGNALKRFRHKAEFGICILREYWGNGIGRNLLERVLQWSDEVGIVKVSLTVVEVNTKAIQLYREYGFIEEGLLRKDRVHRDGNYYNTIIMGRFSV